MRIRLMGTPGECEATVAVLSCLDRLAVVEVSDQYPNRGSTTLVRVYVEVRLADQSTGSGR